MRGAESITFAVCCTVGGVRFCWWQMFCFCAFPEYLQIFPEGTLQRDVAPPVFKAQLIPRAPQQIIFLVSPAGKKTPSLLGFGCHIILNDARANSTFPSVPTGKVRIKKASDREIRGGLEILCGSFAFQKNPPGFFSLLWCWVFFKVVFFPFTWSSIFNKADMHLTFPCFPLTRHCITTPSASPCIFVSAV